jgi:uncharacterized protein YndB with AHSA1/START domain
MSTTTTQSLSLKVSRLIKAPRERVFAAWTTADQLVQWLGGGSPKLISASIDVRVGGDYRLKATGGHCEMDMVGQFREVKPPERLVFTWSVGNCLPEYKGMQTIVTVELTEQKGGTLVQLTHEGFVDAEIRDRHDKGWNASFDVLECCAQQ